jgi:hypothetical protein
MTSVEILSHGIVELILFVLTAEPAYNTRASSYRDENSVGNGCVTFMIYDSHWGIQDPIFHRLSECAVCFCIDSLGCGENSNRYRSRDQEKRRRYSRSTLWNGDPAMFDLTRKTLIYHESELLRQVEKAEWPHCTRR